MDYIWMNLNLNSKNAVQPAIYRMNKLERNHPDF